MLVKLTAEQIANNWNFIKQHIYTSNGLATELTPEQINNLLQLLLIDELQCWAAARINPEKTDIFGIVVTQVLYDNVLDEKNLLMYSAVGFNNVYHLKTWTRCLLSLAQYARSRDCKRVLAFTDNPELVKLGERMKGKTDRRLIVFTL